MEPEGLLPLPSHRSPRQFHGRGQYRRLAHNHILYFVTVVWCSPHLCHDLLNDVLPLCSAIRILSTFLTFHIHTDALPCVLSTLPFHPPRFDRLVTTVCVEAYSVWNVSCVVPSSGSSRSGGGSSNSSSGGGGGGGGSNSSSGGGGSSSGGGSGSIVVGSSGGSSS